MSVITRFAPSPTGYLHIGSARTALFNWLFARHHKGQFLLRIEDTDRQRSTDDAIDAIFKSLNWLGIQWDGDATFQFQRAPRHAEVAHKLLEEGKAYYCYCSPEELEQMRNDAQQNGLPPRYNGYWRDRNPSEAPKDRKPVIRFKAPQTGETVIHDLVQGEVRIQNQQLDDMVLLRADGTPTYMLSVVVDDHDMNITHIIRGDDHLTNAFRQYHLYIACGWKVPEFAHIPLIHGPDGTKLSKRHGALGAEAYQDMGFLPEAMRNYLLRLGWSHGDEEIIGDEKAIEWFNLETIGRSPARFDIAKLTSLNAHYIRNCEPDSLICQINPFIHSLIKRDLTDIEKDRIRKGFEGLAQRSKTLTEFAENSLIYVQLPDYDEKSKQILTDDNKSLLKDVHTMLNEHKDWSLEGVEAVIRTIAAEKLLKLGDLAQVLRVAVAHRTISPSLFDVLSILGSQETLKRIQDASEVKF